MSVFDLFRRFFYPPGTRDPFFGGMTYDEDDEDDGGDDDFFAQQSPFRRHRPPFPDPFGFDDLFRDFNELFADFGSMIPDVSRIEPPTQSPGRSGTGSLRDFMLKYPDSHLPTDPTTPPRGPSSSSQGPDQPRWTPRWEADAGDPKQDKILDSEVSSHGLDSILRPAESASPLQPPSSSSSYFRSVSISRVMRPDGTVEERRTVKDSDGNTNTTVTVTRGDQMISSGTPDPSRDEKDIGPNPHRALPDLSDSQTILSRILHRWFSS